MNLFDAEVARMRQDAELIQGDATMRRMLASFAKARSDRKARGEDPQLPAQTQAQNDADELALFNRAEARAINNGFN